MPKNDCWTVCQLEKDFKRTLATHFAKQKKQVPFGEDPATAVTRCLTCGHRADVRHSLRLVRYLICSFVRSFVRSFV